MYSTWNLIEIDVLLFRTIHVVDCCGIAQSWRRHHSSSFAGVIIHIRHTARGSKSENRELNEIQERKERRRRRVGNTCDYADQWAIALFMALSQVRAATTSNIQDSPFFFLALYFPSFFHSISILFLPSFIRTTLQVHEPNIFPLLQLISVENLFSCFNGDFSCNEKTSIRTAINMKLICGVYVSGRV